MYFSYLQGLLQVKIDYHEQMTMQTQYHVRKGAKSISKLLIKITFSVQH